MWGVGGGGFKMNTMVLFFVSFTLANYWLKSQEGSGLAGFYFLKKVVNRYSLCSDYPEKAGNIFVIYNVTMRLCRQRPK